MTTSPIVAKTKELEKVLCLSKGFIFIILLSNASDKRAQC